MNRISIPKSRFHRAFDRGVTPAKGRLHVPEKTDVVGKRKDASFRLYRERKGIFPLFSLTLYGKIEEEEITFSFSRSRAILPFWLLWCFLFFFAGLSLLHSEPLSALTFLVPGILLFLPILLHSKKEKERLLSHLKALTDKEKDT